ncbi:hypothetical protein FOA52_009819 [Chlamydomonas sp. UWO 241]|nr:hypothetical protein FOA52_009819 [Chlamydomonas sp. UWO 241]
MSNGHLGAGMGHTGGDYGEDDLENAAKRQRVSMGDLNSVERGAYQQGSVALPGMQQQMPSAQDAGTYTFSRPASAMHGAPAMQGGSSSMQSSLSMQNGFHQQQLQQQQLQQQQQQLMQQQQQQQQHMGGLGGGVGATGGMARLAGLAAGNPAMQQMLLALQKNPAMIQNPSVQQALQMFQQQAQQQQIPMDHKQLMQEQMRQQQQQTAQARQLQGNKGVYGDGLNRPGSLGGPMLGSLGGRAPFNQGFGGHSLSSNPQMMHQLLMQRQQQQRLHEQQQATIAAQMAAQVEDDREDEVLSKVARISENLRSMLGKNVTEKGFGGTGDEGGDCGAGGSAEVRAALTKSSLVRRDNLIEACGPIAAQLKSYQLVGINFLMMLHKNDSVGGAILADEMGLGKTAQTISFLGALRTMQGNRQPHLVICPASLIQNWAREFKQWCPGMRVLMYHGKERDNTREVLNVWRRKVRAAQKEGIITDLPAGMLTNADEEAREQARQEQLDMEREQDLEEPPSYGEAHSGDEGAGGLFDDSVQWDPSLPVGGVMLPPIDSGEPAFDVMLTTYTLFEREGGYIKDRAFLLKWAWSYLVADEAHALKNRSSIRTRKLRKVAATCGNRILLTGTPLQNSLEELRALLEFLMPSLFIDPAHPENDRDDETHMRKRSEEDQEMRVERYKALLAPFILRRLKSEVATQLIAKKHVVEEVEMTPMQAALYKKAVESMRKEVAAATVAAQGKPGRRPGRKSGSSARLDEEGADGMTPPPALPSELANPEMLVAKLGSQRVNNIFTHLRKVAQHPLLVRNLYSDEQIARMAELSSEHGLFGGNCTYDRVLKELTGYSDHQLHTFSSSWPGHLGSFMLPDSALMASAKITMLDGLMPKLYAAGSKVLLFSQWTMTLDLLEWYMSLKGFSHVRLDGSTQVEDRLAIVDRFNDPTQGVFCFLLSTRAGGQGLNLTGADIVVLHDVDFNPQVDRQAEDRCHRLGQTKPVTVYRLVTKGTVDQNVLSIAERKLALDAAVLSDVTIGDGDGDAGDDADGKAKAKAKKKAAAGPDAKEVRHMGAILSALLSDQ